MKSIPLILSLMMLVTGPACASDRSAELKLPAYSTHYDPGRDPFADGHAAIRLAQQTGRRVLIELGGDWCKWCHVLDDFLASNADVNARLHQTFVMLKVNVSDANDNHEFLAAFPRPLGYPHMYIADNNGRLLKSQDTGEFLQNGRYSRQRFMAFFDAWQTGPDSNTTKTTDVSTDPAP